MELEGKVAIVTGAGQGMGRVISLELAKEGANLVLADIREDTTGKVKREIEGIRREALPITTDVAKWEDAQAMAKKAMERFGRIDILVNNAGISPKKGKGATPLRILDIGDQDWDNLLDVNLKGVFNCSKAVMPSMIKQRSGKIVNIASIVGMTGGGGSSPASAHYCVSKAGVICLTKVLARELAQYNINVNAIAPGRTLTDRNLAEMADPGSQESTEKLRKETPLGRFGMPIDIARGVLFLALDSGNFITGETIVMDGGRTMH